MINDDRVVTTSTEIGKSFGINHNEVLKKIRDFDCDGVIFTGKSDREVRGRKFDIYELTMAQALKLIMLISSKRSWVFKESFISLICSGVSISYSYEGAIKEVSEFKDNNKVPVTYIIRNVITGKFKIGRTSQSLGSRLMALQCSTGEALEVYAYIIGDIELSLHRKYSEKRCSSEWFSLTDEDIYDISRKNRSSFRYCDTFESLLFELWHDSEVGEKEPELSDFFKKDVTARKLNFAMKSLNIHMNSSKSYKEILILVKQDLEDLGKSLMIEIK